MIFLKRIAKKINALFIFVACVKHSTNSFALRVLNAFTPFFRYVIYNK